MIKPKSINFSELVKNSNSTLSLDVQSKIVDKLNNTFTENEQHWYIANLYMYMNYHSTNDYPINLEDVFKMIGFANKGNAKRTLENNFTKDEDYKVVILRTEKNLNIKDLGGRPDENIMLNIDTFKNLCMIAKTESGKEIRRYYVKLENIYNEIIKEEIEQQKVLLENNKKELQQTQQQLKKEKIHKNQILRRKYYDMKQGDAIYLYKDDENNERSLLKIGKSKNISEREKVYSNMSKNGSIIYVKRCLNCDLTESLLHHLLDKYRINSMQEWFELPSEEFGKQIIDTIINLIDLQIENIYTFIPTLQNFINTNNTNINNNIDNNIEDTNTNEQLDTEPKFDIKRVNPKDFDRFIKECCELSLECKTPKADIKRAHRIWSKCSIKDVVSSLDNYLKTNFKSGVDIQDDIKKNIYKGIRLKPLNYTPENDPFLDYETFIIEKCEVNWNYKISYVDFFNNFVSWKKLIDPDYNLQFKYKKDIQKYLERHFAGGRVFLSNDSSNTHLFGVWGLGISSNNFGSKIPKRTTKKVSEYNSSTNQLIRSWESLSVASRQLNIPVSTLSNYCRFNTIVSDSVFKYELS
jgi:phage anti-repressor protein